MENYLKIGQDLLKVNPNEISRWKISETILDTIIHEKYLLKIANKIMFIRQ